MLMIIRFAAILAAFVSTFTNSQTLLASDAKFGAFGFVMGEVCDEYHPSSSDRCNANPSKPSKSFKISTIRVTPLTRRIYFIRASGMRFCDEEVLEAYRQTLKSKYPSLYDVPTKSRTKITLKSDKLQGQINVSCGRPNITIWINYHYFGLDDMIKAETPIFEENRKKWDEQQQNKRINRMKDQIDASEL